MCIDSFIVASSLGYLITIFLPSEFKIVQYLICRQLFQRVIIPLSVLSTGLCCVIPEANAFILMLFGAPIICLLFDEYKR